MKSMDMTNGPIRKQILFFSVPLILSNLLQVMFNLADVAVVGKFAGEASLGAVGSTVTLINLYVGLFIGLGSGVNALVALSVGAKDNRKVSITVHTSLVILTIAGFLLMGICLLLAKPTLSLLGTKKELFSEALLYVSVYATGFPATSLYNFGNGVYAANGNTKKPLMYLTLAGILNLVLNLLFVIVFKMGVLGVALASSISQYVSGILIVASLFKSKEAFRLNRSMIKIDKEIAVKLLGLGIPSALQNAIFQFANLFIQGAVNTFDAITVEGTAAATNADSIVYNSMNAFYVACTSFIGQNMGAKKRDRMIKSYYISLAYSFLIALLIGLVLFFFSKEFLYLFATDERVINAGITRLNIMAFSYCISAFMDNTIAASRGLGKTALPTLFVILGSCVFRIIWIFTIFVYFHTVGSLFLLYAFSWTLTAIAEIIYFAQAYKKAVIDF